MHIILVRRNSGSKQLWWVLLGLLSVGTLLGGVAYVAYRIGKTQSSFQYNALSVANPPAQCTPDKATDEQLNALVQRIGGLQAEVVKLDSLGQQLVQMSQVDKKEFDFSASWDNIVTEQQLIEAEEGGNENSATPQRMIKPSHLAELELSTQGLARGLRDRQDKFSVLEGYLLNRRFAAKVLPAGWPIKQGYLSSGFGWRGANQQSFHEGVDLIAQENTSVFAVDEGVIVKSGVMSGYGNIVEIRHSHTYSTRYAHNSKNLVNVGERVKKGQTIALVGSTGRASTAHVHFELIEAGKQINPVRYLSAANQVKLSDNIRLSER